MDTTTKIIDIHNHVLPLVDDGSKSFEEAIDSINYLSSLGVTDIVLTSHYIDETDYTKSVYEREQLLNKLKSAVKSVNLYLGNEVYITYADTLIRLLEEKKITTLNGSKYLLIEFPLHQRLNIIESVICSLNEIGITPIIAHPERYKFIQEDFNKIYDLLEYDILLQCNMTSFIGYYGKDAKKAIKRMLKENLVSFLSTDFHHIPKSTDKYKEAIDALQKNIGDRLSTLVYDNPLKVIKNEDIKLTRVAHEIKFHSPVWFNKIKRNLTSSSC